MKNKRSIREWLEIVLSNLFYSRLFRDSNRDITKTVFLSSVPRSGSTFLMEAINYRKDYRVMFEPFHHGKIRLTEKFEYPHYLAPEKEDDEVKDIMRQVLSGSLRNSWIDAHNRIMFVDKRLIKCVRTNLMLKYINRNFSEVPLVLLIRNPFAVVNSWTRSNYNHLVNRERILKQPELVKEYLSSFIEEYKSIEDPFELHLFNWCINHYIPLKQFSNNEIHIVFFESILENTETEVKRLFDYLEAEFSDKIYEQMKKPSRTTRKSDISKMGKGHLKSWASNFTSEQFDRGNEILKKFNLDKFYHNDQPSYEALENFLEN
jgi:hypothetical protein